MRSSRSSFKASLLIISVFFSSSVVSFSFPSKKFANNSPSFILPKQIKKPLHCMRSSLHTNFFAPVLMPLIRRTRFPNSSSY
ncbi:hypothetical protein V8C40DRAFT_256979, partial [Trichoderma camerunense]